MASSATAATTGTNRCRCGKCGGDDGRNNTRLSTINGRGVDSSSAVFAATRTGSRRGKRGGDGG